jgi:hypothetical protein
VQVKIAAGNEFSRWEMHRVEFQRLVRDASFIFRNHFNIRFKVEEFIYWKPDKACDTIIDSLCDLKQKVPRGSSEIVIGFISSKQENIIPPGISSYLDGYVLLKNLKHKKTGMKFVLIHELLHLFGAIDICEPGSIMSVNNPCFRIDGFTKKIICVNKFRSFKAGVFPLSNERIIDAIILYKERSNLNLGEYELNICLNHLRSAGRNQY